MNEREGEMTKALAALAGAIPAELGVRIDHAVADAARQATPLKVGDQAPAFTLEDAFGRRVSLSQRLKHGPAVITFYRGAWCPFCNIELHALQEALPEFVQRHASLIAISPQTPDETRNLVDREGVSFTVLSDGDQEVIGEYGLRYEVTGDARALYEDVFQTDLAKENGDGTWSIPLPATYVIDEGGVIVAAHVDPDYRARMDVTHITSALDRIIDEGSLSPNT